MINVLVTLMFFEGLNIPTLSNEDTKLLDSPISLKELHAAFNEMK